MRIAVASRSFSRHPILREELSSLYDHVTFNDRGISLNGVALVDFLKGHDGAIIALENMTSEIFSQLPELNVISKYGVGLDMIDFDAMKAHGVKLAWTGGVNRRAVSELVLSNMIALLRHVPVGHRQVQDGQWKQLVGRQLTGSVVGIIGCGHVGKDLVRLLQPFDCTLLVNDLLEFPDFYAEFAVTPVDLETLLKKSDIVSVHLPLDQSTTNLLSADRLVLMKSQAILINASRGGIVDERKLKDMLISGSLAGAAFDVFSIEPPEDTELLNLPNFLPTPHIGGSSEEAILAMGRAAIKGLSEVKLVP